LVDFERLLSARSGHSHVIMGPLTHILMNWPNLGSIKYVDRTGFPGTVVSLIALDAGSAAVL
jgi:hypothetical protein